MLDATSLPALEGLPLQRQGAVLFRYTHFVEVRDLGMAGLNFPQAPLDFVAVLQFALAHALLEGRERLFHPRGKATVDRLLFGLSRCRAAQDVGLLALRSRYELHFHIGPYLLPATFQELLLKLLQLRARRAHQVLPAAPAQ